MSSLNVAAHRSTSQHSPPRRARRSSRRRSSGRSRGWSPSKPRTRRSPSPTTPSTASARACGPATPTRCTRCEAHPPPSSHHQSAHPVHCAQVCSAPIAQGWRAGVSRRLSLRTLQVPRAIQAGRVWVNWCVDMSPQPPTPTPPTPPPPALASACLPPDSPAPVRKLPRLPGARPVRRLQEVGLRPRDAQDDAGPLPPDQEHAHLARQEQAGLLLKRAQHLRCRHRCVEERSASEHVFHVPCTHSSSADGVPPPRALTDLSTGAGAHRSPPRDTRTLHGTVSLDSIGSLSR